MGAGQLGIFTKAFSTICGNFFLEIPVSQLNLGHWSFLVDLKKSAYRIVVCNTHIAILWLFQRSETNLF